MEKDDASSIRKMSFLEHLDELRKRLIRVIIAVIIAFLFCWYFAREIYHFLEIPILQLLPEGKKLVYIGVTDPFFLLMKVALLAALFFSSPYVLYELWLFVSPGLYKREKRYAVPFVAFSSLFFVGGGAFGYYVAFPMACQFLLKMGKGFEAMITIDKYFYLLSRILLGLGLVFQMPILTFFLARIGVVTHRFLLKYFRHAVVLIAIAAAVITPTPDIPTMMAFTVPMVGLYLLGIGVAWLFGKERIDALKERREKRSLLRL